MPFNGLTSQPAINRSFFARGIVTGWPRLAASEAKGRLGETHRRILLSRGGGSSRARRPERPGRKNHQRVQKATTGATTDYLFDLAGHVIGEANDSTGSTTTEYVFMEGELLAQIDSSGNIYYAHNSQVSAAQKMTDASRTLVFDRIQEPFGEDSSTPTNTDPTNHRFPGQYADAEDLLNQNNNREYDPTLGYIEADPSGFRGGLNLFGYALQNPTQVIDPSGLDGSLYNSGSAASPVFINASTSGTTSATSASAQTLTAVHATGGNTQQYFELANPSQGGGYIIQQNDMYYLDRSGNHLQSYSFWEAWSVAPGQTHVTPITGWDDNVAFDKDAAAECNAAGAGVTQTARYYDASQLSGGKLPSSFQSWPAPGSVRQADGLPSTTTDPGLPLNVPTVSRTLTNPPSSQ